MVATALTSSLSLVDMGFIARLGTIQVAAVSTSSSVVRLLTGVGTGVATAVLGISARSVGADRPEEVFQVAVNGVSFSILIGATLCTAVGIFARPVLSLFTREPELLSLGTIYLRYMLAGLTMLFGYTASAALFHSWGDTRRPLFIMAGANVLNVVLDPIFIFGLGPIPALGLRGAGLASFLGNALALVAAVALLFRNDLLRKGRARARSDHPSGKHVPVNRALIANITRLAIPASAQAVMRPASGMVLLWIVSFYGTAALAAFGIGLKLTMFSGVFMTGLTAAVASIVGRELGAERVSEARGTVGLALSRGLAIFVPVGVAYFAAAGILMRIFSSDAEVIAMGARYIRILAPSLLFLAVMATFSGTFQGAGDTLSLMQTSILANAPFKLGVAVLLGLVWPKALWGVWLGIALSIVVEAGLLAAWYRNGRWYRHANIDWR